MCMYQAIKKISIGVLFLLLFVLVAGCTGDSGSSNATITSATGTTAPGSGPAYVAGDIVKSPTGSSTAAWLILGYDASSDMYERAFIYANPDGSWGYRLDTKTEKFSRTLMEKVYTQKITNKAPSSIPVRTPTIPSTTATLSTTATVTATTTTISSTVKPSIRNIIPDEGTAGNVISITDLVGNNFQSGATVTLMKSDNPNITATNVNVVSSTLITCTLSPPSDTASGSWDVVVTNPSGQYGIYTNLFIIHGSANPTATTTSTGGIGITTIDPTFVISASGTSTYLPISVYGSNFQNGITAKLTRSGKSDIIASTISRTDTTQMRCFFNIPESSQGTWNLVLTNTDGTTGILEDAFEVRT
jgi:hypothetical protein